MLELKGLVDGILEALELLGIKDTEMVVVHLVVLLLELGEDISEVDHFVKLVEL